MSAEHARHLFLPQLVNKTQNVFQIPWGGSQFKSIKNVYINVDVDFYSEQHKSS